MRNPESILKGIDLFPNFYVPPKSKKFKKYKKRPRNREKLENNYRLKGLEGPPASPLQVSLVYEYVSKGWGGAKPNPAHKAAKKNRKIELPPFLTIF